MKVLVTGATGFVGSHMLELLLRKDVEVAGFKRPRSSLDNVSHILNRVKWYTADLADYASVLSAIIDFKPDRIFHLGAHSFVPMSWAAPAIVMDVNVRGTVNILEAVRHSTPKARIQLACSSEEYGLVKPDETPIKETNPLRPLSPYGVSKVATDLLGYQYHKSYGIHAVRTRGFNHSGKRRGSDFVLSSFAKQVIEVKKGSRDFIRVGNLDAIRDFTDVRDMVEAYWLSLVKCPSEVYNIATGQGWKISDALNMLCTSAGLDAGECIKIDESLIRPSDVPVLIGDSTKFRKISGWEPKYTFAELLDSILEYWEERVK